MAVRPDHRDQLNSLDQHRQLISKLPSVQSCHCYTLVSLDHHNTIKNSSNLPVMQLQLTQHHSKRYFYFLRRSPRFVEKKICGGESEGWSNKIGKDTCSVEASSVTQMRFEFNCLLVCFTIPRVRSVRRRIKLPRFVSDFKSGLL